MELPEEILLFVYIKRSIIECINKALTCRAITSPKKKKDEKTSS